MLLLEPGVGADVVSYELIHILVGVGRGDRDVTHEIIYQIRACRGGDIKVFLVVLYGFGEQHLFLIPDCHFFSDREGIFVDPSVCVVTPASRDVGADPGHDHR